ncbi:MAG: TetR/AcrR family transcriptional regulator [Synechococcales bacterium]|nr:TetR/AcrR family transcriptional regulator [Cyanobacteria bacterium REEB444]MEB3124619.1 TetR/AcrR family transcriptional regulator [Synechococcales bacterium]
MPITQPSSQSEVEIRSRILLSALSLFARRGYAASSTKELAKSAGIAEGTLFRHFENKKAILIEIVTQGWIDILTDLLTELSEMGSYHAIAQVMRRRMFNLHKNADLMKVCFMETQFHPDLRDRIQSEIVDKMTTVAEAFFEEAMKKGIYRPMNVKTVSRVFIGMFAITGFSYGTLTEPGASHEDLKQMAEGVADIFLNGVLQRS